MIHRSEKEKNRKITLTYLSSINTADALMSTLSVLSSLSSSRLSSRSTSSLNEHVLTCSGSRENEGSAAAESVASSMMGDVCSCWLINGVTSDSEDVRVLSETSFIDAPRLKSRLILGLV